MHLRRLSWGPSGAWPRSHSRFQLFVSQIVTPRELLRPLDGHSCSSGEDVVLHMANGVVSTIFAGQMASWSLLTSAAARPQRCCFLWRKTSSRVQTGIRGVCMHTGRPAPGAAAPPGQMLDLTWSMPPTAGRYAGRRCDRLHEWVDICETGVFQRFGWPHHAPLGSVERGVSGYLLHGLGWTERTEFVLRQDYSSPEYMLKILQMPETPRSRASGAWIEVSQALKNPWSRDVTTHAGSTSPTCISTWRRRHWSA